MLDFSNFIWESFLVVSATHFSSKGCQYCVKLAAALCSGFFVVAIAVSVSCLVWFHGLLVFSQGSKCKGCYRGSIRGLIASWEHAAWCSPVILVVVLIELACQLKDELFFQPWFIVSELACELKHELFFQLGFMMQEHRTMER